MSGNKLTNEQLRQIVENAHHERAEAVAQLFGFGFTVLKNTLRGVGRGAAPSNHPEPRVAAGR